MAESLHHLVEGSGPESILMLGSLGSTLAMWDPQLPALAARSTTVRADLRGHGRSPVPPGPYAIDDLVDDVVALLDELRIERCHLVGLSLGGMIAIRLAARHPERVRRTVVLCTATSMPPSTNWRERAALVRAEGTGAVARSVVERWVTPGWRAANPEAVAAMEAMVATTPREGYAGCCEVIERLDLAPDLAAVRSPLLAIAGAQDPAAPPERLAQIADGVAEGRFQVLDGAAHLASYEQADRVTDAIVAHLGLAAVHSG